MQKNVNISMSVIRRLPRYYRYLKDLKDKNILRISSRELSDKMGITASQIRQDLNCFGEFGQQGYGYNIELLFGEISRILGLNNRNKIILIGAGNLGKAIVTHMDFESKGFDLVGIFDNNEYVIGKKILGTEIRPNLELGKFCLENKPIAAILCIPTDGLEDLIGTLVSYGIKAFWNFAHIDMQVNRDDIIVENVHLSDSLMTLSYQIQQYLAENKENY